MQSEKEMAEFNSFFKSVGGNEGERCHYSTRLDTYGCGCAHNCAYCYARSLLAFRGLWKPNSPSVTSKYELSKALAHKMNAGDVVRLGGMTDCFQPAEREYHRTLDAIRMCNWRGIHYLIVTKSPLVAEYADVLSRELAHIQISITSTSAEKSLEIEPGAPVPAERIAAVEQLAAKGFDVSVRLSPFIPEFVDLSVINAIKCDKILVEFLRVNGFISKWLRGAGISLSRYSYQSEGYKHLPLADKVALLEGITGFKQHSVCEDVPEHWAYWQTHYNTNPDDCCNLRI